MQIKTVFHIFKRTIKGGQIFLGSEDKIGIPSIITFFGQMENCAAILSLLIKIIEETLELLYNKVEFYPERFR